MTDTGFDFTTFQRQVIDEFRANGGRVGGPFQGSALALLTTVGARTGKPRTSPLAYLVIDGVPVVVASAMGADKNPDWYHNIRQHPIVTVETGTETFQAVAEAPAGPVRDALFAKVVAREPGFADYQKKTTRPIPVVTLTRLDPAHARGLGDFLVTAHDGLRAELAALRRQADDLIADGAGSSRSALVHQLHAHCREFCAAVEQHHTGEDRGAFPMLARRFPALTPVLERLGEDHATVARLQRELRTLVDSYDPAHTDPARLRTDLAELTDRLESHFRYEEQMAVGPLNTLGPAPDFG
ncbi:nitroreductase/quinone reductase family protein [Actinoplanes sp. DH11]|uniref:nitroreductase/quinone reductase family protein n=1 Tax=Actinoplanes sp. DH11 TaxID=2857011 RepID=UPI001E50F804|nr:nitroreductase/quinone reductase family protein [Actinoplanes sp. DH11]